MSADPLPYTLELLAKIDAAVEELAHRRHSDEELRNLDLTIGAHTARTFLKHGVFLLDKTRERSWIDERVYEGALRRGHAWQDLAEARAPVPMILHCPACHQQHVDAPEPPGWLNPPHRSHRCAGCGWIWRPADIATVGVAAIATTGRLDGTHASSEAAAENAAPPSEEAANV